MNDTVESAVSAIDPFWICVGILIAVITVIPIENDHTAIGSNFLCNGHEPNVIAGQEIGLAETFVSRTGALDAIAIDASSMDIAHVEFIAILFGICWRIEILDSAIGRHLVFVLHYRVGKPGVRWVRAALTKVVGGLGQMPKMVDHAGADECTPLVIKSDAPWVTRPFTEQVEFLGDRVNAKHRTSKVEYTIVLFDNRSVEEIGRAHV